MSAYVIMFLYSFINFAILYFMHYLFYTNMLAACSCGSFSDCTFGYIPVAWLQKKQGDLNHFLISQLNLLRFLMRCFVLSNFTPAEVSISKVMVIY